jgi:hypothetical protein
MSEPGSIPPPPPPVSPFQPRPLEPAPTRGGGCGKPVVIGCVAALLLGAIAVLGGIYYIGSRPDAINKMMLFSLTQMENGVMQQLPAGVTPEEKTRLQTAFAGAREAIQAGRTDPAQLQEFNFKVLEFSRKGRNASRQDVLELTETLESLARGEPVRKGGGGTS